MEGLSQRLTRSLAIKSPVKNTETKTKTKIRRNEKRNALRIQEDQDYEEEVEISPALDYFIGVSSKTKSTEEKTIEFQEVDETNVNYLGSDMAMNTLRARNTSKFGHMMLLLKEKFAVIVYGFGSKRSLLLSFIDKYLSDEKYLLINGYFPGLAFKDIASHLKDFLDADNSDRDSLVEAARQLDQDLFLVIHSIDVLFSSNTTRVKNLILDMVIASEGRLRLLASVDHLNSSLVFDSTARTKMDLVWIHTKTFVPFTIERGYTLSANTASNTAILTLNSVLHVYSSLTPNAQKIFLQILEFCVDKKEKAVQEKKRGKELKAVKRLKRKRKRPRKLILEDEDDQEQEEEEENQNEMDDEEENEGQVENKKTEDEDILPLSTLYRICREEYLVNSEITLKAQLTEFQDHDIIKVSKAGDGSSVVKLKLRLEVAQSFLRKVKETDKQ